MRYGPYIERAICSECSYVFEGDRGAPCPTCGYSPWHCGWGFHPEQVGRWLYEGPWYWRSKTWVPRGEESAHSNGGR